MDNQIIVAYFIIFLLFLSSIILGISNYNLNIKTMHITIAILFIFIVLSGINTHLKRLITKSPYNYIAWLHIIIFNLLIFLSIKILKHWTNIGIYFKKNIKNPKDINIKVDSENKNLYQNNNHQHHDHEH